MFCSKCFSIIENNLINCACECAGIINEYHVQDIEINQIYSDPSFNCRGIILPMDVVDLVKDIEKVGLLSPISIQPIKDVEDLPPEDFTFRVVAGHRRLAAFKILKRETIPAMIKVGLNEVQARLINLGENLKREALNILQEAKAIKRLKKLGLNRRQVGEELGVSTSWVQVRFNLLDLPPEVQNEAAAGLLNQYQIKEIHGLGSKEKQFDAVKQIKNARLKGEKGISVSKTPQEDPFKKRRQPKNVVQGMIDHLGDTIGFGLHTRVLAWANGEINSAELYMGVRDYAKEHNLEYHIPIAGLKEEKV